MTILNTQGAAKQAEKSAFPLMKINNFPSNFYLTKLDNGLEVLAIEDANVPLATIEIVVRNGAFVQTPDLEGLAHLYEHMFFKANKDYPSQEAFLDRINELGIVFNGTTSNERVNYFVTLNKSKTKEGLEFINSAIRYPKFLQEEMKKENVVVAGEFQRNESNPVFFLLRDMDKKLWGDQFPRKNSIGRYEVILNATPEIMQSIKDRYYYPNNSMLVIAGDIKHNEVFENVKNIYGSWAPSGFSIFEKYPIPEFAPLKESSNFITENAISQVPIVMKSFHGPDTRRDIASTYPADVWSNMLGQKNSKFQKALLEAGLVYQVSGGYQTEKYTGPIQFLMVPNPQKMQEAMKVLDEEIKKMESPDYFTDVEIQSAKDMIEVDDVYGKEKTSSYVHLVTYWWASATLDYYSNYTDNIKKVTKQDIAAFIKKYITNKPSVTGVLVSPQMRTMTKLDTYFKAN
jgi:zinc protease